MVKQDTTQKKKYDFMVSSDFEAYEKVMAAKKEYEAGGKSYTIEEAYNEGIKKLNFEKTSSGISTK